MAGRSIVLHKLASRMAGSTSLLCTSRASGEGCFGDLSNNLLRGASAHPSTMVTKHSGIRDYAAKYLNYPLPCSWSPAAKMVKPTTTGMPSHRTRPASADSVRGVKRTFSSSSSDKGAVDWEARKAIFLADLEANKANISKACYESEKAAIVADFDALKVRSEADAKANRESIEALKEKMNKRTAELKRFLNILLVGSVAVILMAAYEFRWSPRAQRGRCRWCGRGCVHVENADAE